MIRERFAAKRSVEPSGFRWRGGEVSRLEQFSDAVFAFALALLVVSLDVPRSADELFAILGEFPAFGATFATLVWIWHNHYVYFRRFGFVDAFTVFLNAVLLFLILFYVYPLKFIFGALFDGLAGAGMPFTWDEGKRIMAIYSLGFVAVFGMFALMYRHALRLRDDLELNELEILMTRASMTANVLILGVGAVAGAMAWFGPPWMAPIAGFFYAMIGPVMWWHWARVDRRRKLLVPASAA